ncbi:ABC transporter substrate-binding protein [Paenibacillus radicis (ex Xue et al. 2023)]|uniref:ABC transporter substrate-binding protein n=1 Tax=Paenibacillus radicis (ex Xue et al. 2023) TaxID=2972489 RepID=A0ABT1YIZ6_9BACL|nr:ABC transporter substrate-binding protein [Paenibacillus radicis (ex Xue et al. 2023)]MCR8633157.1 ABC transporter substrate-binding protein [Paenibacillus radicis (ex Xue et al. 2023)]
MRSRSRSKSSRPKYSGFLALILVIILVTLSACQSSSSSKPTGNGQSTDTKDASAAGEAKEQVLKYVTLNMPRSLDPVHIDAQRITSDGIAEPLVMLNDDGSIRPWLVKSWKNLEPTLWEVELQPNVKFWSGAVMDAAAVKAALERHQKLNKRGPSQIGGVEFIVKDSLHLQLKTPKPDPNFIFKLNGFAIHNAEEANRLGDKFNSQADLTGFMKPIQFTPGELLIAEAFPGYWGEKPKLQRLEARLGADAQARLLALKNGDADADMNVEVEQRVSYEKDPKLATYFPIGQTTNLWLNMKKVPALQDKNVRIALNLAVDRKELIEGVSRGFASKATGHFPAGLPYAISTGAETDKAKAEKLLDEAGWKKGSDGIRAKDGQKLKLKMLTYTVFQPLAVALQSQLKNVGVEIELNPVETTASNQMMLDGNFDTATYCSCGTATGDIGGQLYSYYQSGVASNYGGYSNPEVDKLISQLTSEFDAVKQVDLAKQIQTRVQEDVPIIYLFNNTRWGAAYNSKVKGIDKNLQTRIVPGMYISK